MLLILAPYIDSQLAQYQSHTHVALRPVYAGQTQKQLLYRFRRGKEGVCARSAAGNWFLFDFVCIVFYDSRADSCFFFVCLCFMFVFVLSEEQKLLQMQILQCI